MKKVLLINQGYINGNLGDQAIRENLNHYFSDRSFEINNAFLTAPFSKKKGVPNEDYFNLNKNISSKKRKTSSLLKKYLGILYWILKSVPAILSTLNKNRFDYIIIGGGQIINSSRQSQPHSFAVAVYIWTKMISLFSSRSKVLFVGIGVSKTLNSFEKKLYKKALNQAYKIVVRDSFSLERIAHFFKIKATLMPDVAFYGSKNIIQNKRKDIVLFGIYSFLEFKTNYNSKNISKEAYYNLWYEKLYDYRKKGKTIKLFYTTETDYIESISFQEFLLKNKNLEIQVLDIKSLSDLYLHYSDAQIIYSARMHGLLLGFKLNCVVEPFLISEKLVSFKEEYLNSNLTAREFSLLVEEKLDTLLNFSDEG